MTLTEAITTFLSVLTLLGDLFLIVIAILFLIGKLNWSKLPVWQWLQAKLRIYGLIFAFTVAIVATMGSLFYSELAGYNPCKLCWVQRIFMYPQVMILGFALVKKFKREVVYYSVGLSSIGAVVAAYHYYLQRWGNSDTPCAVVGYSESCAQIFVLTFGYITIPLMAFTAFSLIIIVMLFYNRQPQNNLSFLRKIFSRLR